MKKLKKFIFLFLIVVLILLCVVIKCRLLNNNKYQEKLDVIVENDNSLEVEDGSSDDEITDVFVDLKGEVVNPGVYMISSDKKIIDVINMAGGLTDNADTSLINLAKSVKDEMVVIIYSKNDVINAKYKNDNKIKSDSIKEDILLGVVNDACLNTKSDNNKKDTSDVKDTNDNDISNGKVNINTASISDFQKLSGIGEGRAKAIVEYREEHGSFRSIEDIKNVSGIGDSLYEKIKDYITV